MKKFLWIISSVLVASGIFLFQKPALAAINWSQCRTEQGTTTIAGGSATQSVTLTQPIIDTTKAFLLTQSTGDVNVRKATDHMVNGRIFNANTLQFGRTGNSGVVNISYTLVECFNSEFSVQSGVIQLDPGEASDTAAISTSDTSRSIVLVTSATDQSSTDETTSLVTGALQDSTHVIVQRSSAAALTTTRVQYQVVTFDVTSSVTVQNNEVTLSPSSSSTTDTLTTAVDPARTWLYCSYDATDNGLEQTSIGCDLTSDTTVTIQRALPDTYTNRVHYYAVTWPADTVTVQSGSATNDPDLADGTQYDSYISINNPVSNVNKAFSYVTLTADSTSTSYPRNRWLNQLSDTSTLRTTFWRGDGIIGASDDANTKYWQVIEFPTAYQATGWGWVGVSADGTNGTGLISFNCHNLDAVETTTTCGNGTSPGTRYDYGVTLEHGGCASNCDVSGQAWIGTSDGSGGTETLGMIDFDPVITGSATEPPTIAGDDSSTPEDETKDAHWNEQTGELYGWARIRSLQDYEDTLGGTANDWGWVQLRGTTTSTPNANFGVLFDSTTLTFSGWSWNADGTDPTTSTTATGSGLGWLQFDLTNYGGSVSDAWLKTTQSDVYSQGGIDFSTAAPANQYNATYLIQTNGSIVDPTKVSTSTNGSIVNSTNFGGVPTNTSPYQVYRGDLGAIHVNELIATAEANGTEQMGDCSDTSLALHTDPLAGQVYYCSGNLTIDHNLVFWNASGSNIGSGTIVVGGDLTINENLSYWNDTIDQHINNLASVAWIVLGKVTINPTVTKVVGAFVVLGDTDTSSGVYSFSTGSSTLQFTLQGLVMARSFNMERKNTGVCTSSGTCTGPAETFSYDGRVFANPPPGLENFAKVLPTIQ